jgi:hypothetical protein
MDRQREAEIWKSKRETGRIGRENRERETVRREG